MLQYINSFSCHLNESNDTMVLHFMQKEPTIVENDGKEEVKLITNEIASIVMNTDCAKGLISSLSQLYSTSEENNAKED